MVSVKKRIAIDISPFDFNEGDQIDLIVDLKVSGKCKEIRGAVIFQDTTVLSINGPGLYNIHLGQLAPGQYTMSAKCYAHFNIISSDSLTESHSFVVHEIIPEISCTPKTDTFHEKEFGTIVLEVKNTSIYEAKVAGKTLNPYAVTLSEYPVYTSEAGTYTKKIAIIYSNVFGREFVKNLIVSYSVLPVEPELYCGLQKKSYYEGGNEQLLIVIRNVSEHVAVLDETSLEPDAETIKEYPLDSSFVGDFLTDLKIEYQNIHGKIFHHDFKAAYTVLPVEPDVRCQILDNVFYVNDDGLVRIEVTNDSDNPAFLQNVTLHRNESEIIEQIIKTDNPGDYCYEKYIEFRNAFGRSIQQKIKVMGSVLPIFSIEIDKMAFSEFNGLFDVSVKNHSQKKIIVNQYQIPPEGKITGAIQIVEDESFGLLEVTFTTNRGEKRNIQQKIFPSFYKLPKPYILCWGRLQTITSEGVSGDIRLLFSNTSEQSFANISFSIIPCAGLIVSDHIRSINLLLPREKKEILVPVIFKYQFIDGYFEIDLEWNANLVAEDGTKISMNDVLVSQAIFHGNYETVTSKQKGKIRLIPDEYGGRVIYEN